jgi:hypothetical protein
VWWVYIRHDPPTRPRLCAYGFGGGSVIRLLGGGCARWRSSLRRFGGGLHETVAGSCSAVCTEEREPYRGGQAVGRCKRAMDPRSSVVRGRGSGVGGGTNKSSPTPLNPGGDRDLCPSAGPGALTPRESRGWTRFVPLSGPSRPHPPRIGGVYTIWPTSPRRHRRTHIPRRMRSLVLLAHGIAATGTPPGHPAGPRRPRNLRRAANRAPGRRPACKFGSAARRAPYRGDSERRTSRSRCRRTWTGTASTALHSG